MMDSIVPLVLNSGGIIPRIPILNSFIPICQYFEKISNIEENCYIEMCATTAIKRPRKSLQAYYLNIDQWYLSNTSFKENFRILPSTAEELILLLGNSLSNGIPRRPPVDVKRQILFSIWVLANSESFRGVSQRFGLDRGHSHVIFTRFVHSLFAIKHQFINRTAGVIRGRQGFETLRTRNVPGTVGAIDGCQIPIKAPKADKSRYFNRNQYYSVNLQGVCDHTKSFIDIFVGWPGSSHDSRVFRKSPLFEFLESGGLDPGSHLLGDSGYPLCNYLLVPYKDNGRLTAEQRNFNTILSSNRCIIEQAFGLLVVRFRRLKYLDMSKMDLVPKVIVVACILHNICLFHNDLIEDAEYVTPPFDNHTCNNSSADAIAKRDQVARQLFQQ